MRPHQPSPFFGGGFFAFRIFVFPFHSDAGFTLVIHGILIQLNKLLFPECQRCLRIPLLNQILVQLFLKLSRICIAHFTDIPVRLTPQLCQLGGAVQMERQEVQELFVIHLQIPDDPGQEIISGEIVHFVWAVAEDIQELLSVQNR